MFRYFSKAYRVVRELQLNSRITMQLARGAASASSRVMSDTDPRTWEFSGFSQNGEDGIIDFLVQKLRDPNKYFIEIGASNGIENSTAWLAICRKFGGIMIEGSKNNAREIQHNPGVEYLDWFVTQDNILALKDFALHDDPDVLSLDIDGNDYFLAETILESGFRPKIFLVEYNSAFGPEKSQTIQYHPDFVHDTSTLHGYVYYGVSLTGWKTLFSKFGYEFVTVDTNGVNAFFIHSPAFANGFGARIGGSDFKENYYQLTKYRKPWHAQFEYMKDRDFHSIQ